MRLRLLRTGGRPAPLSSVTMEKIPTLATTALAHAGMHGIGESHAGNKIHSDQSSPALPSAANDSAPQAAQDPGPPGAAVVGEHGKDSNSGHDDIGESHAGNKAHLISRLLRCRPPPTIVRLRPLRTRGRPALLPAASMEKIPTLATTASANPTPGTRHSLIIRLLRWRPLPTMSHLRLIRTRGRPAALPSATLEKINSRSIPILATTANLPPGTPHSLTSRPLR